MKRVFDILVCIVILALLSPLFLIVGALIKLDSSGSIFFRQIRVGKDKRPFKIFKFRSMLTNADRIGAYYTSREDPRITRVGAFIRKTSIDELPQLINVILGDMSIVGPRPDVFAQEKLYTPEQWTERHSIRPGITGLAQATYRSDCTPEQRLELDLRYTRDHCFLIYLHVIVLTVRQILTRGGY